MRDPIFRQGDLVSLGVQQGVILALRRLLGRVALIGADPSGRARAASPEISLSLDLLRLPDGTALSPKDLWTGAGVGASGGTDHIRLAEGAVPSWADNQAFLIELLAGLPAE